MRFALIALAFIVLGCCAVAWHFRDQAADPRLTEQIRDAEARMASTLVQDACETRVGRGCYRRRPRSEVVYVATLPDRQEFLFQGQHFDLGYERFFPDGVLTAPDRWVGIQRTRGDRHWRILKLNPALVPTSVLTAVDPAIKPPLGPQMKFHNSLSRLFVILGLTAGLIALVVVLSPGLPRRIISRLVAHDD